MNIFISIVTAWIFVGIIFEAKFKYRLIKRGLYEDWSHELIVGKACERKWYFLLGPVCFINYCLDFGSDREGYCNPFESEAKLLNKLKSYWIPKSFLCYFDIHYFYEKFSVFNIPIQPGKLPKENLLHTTEHCMYCSKIETSKGKHVLGIQGDFVLLKSNNLNPAIVHRIYDMYDNGIMPSGIAKELNLSKTTVHKYLDLRNSN